MELNTILLENIEALIDMFDISEAKCLRECNIHKNFLSNLRGEVLQNPSFKNIYLIAQYFHVSIDSLAEPQRHTKALRDREYTKEQDAKKMSEWYIRLDKRGRTLVSAVIKRERRRMKEEGKFLW